MTGADETTGWAVASLLVCSDAPVASSGTDAEKAAGEVSGATL